MRRWRPGAILLSDFDIKISRISTDTHTLALSDIVRACNEADKAIAWMMRKDYGQQRSPDRR